MQKEHTNIIEHNQNKNTPCKAEHFFERSEKINEGGAIAEQSESVGVN